MAIPTGYKPLPGSERPPRRGATLVGRVEKAERVGVTLLLRPHSDAPEEPGFEHWQATEPRSREHLSADQYMERYGSAEEDLQAVVDFVESKKLRVVQSSAGHGRVVAEGDVAQVNAAFAVTLSWYSAPGSPGARPGPRQHSGSPTRPAESRPADRALEDVGSTGTEQAAIETNLETPPQTTRRLERERQRGAEETVAGHEAGRESGHGGETEAEEDVYRGFEGPVHLPATLVDVVEAVIGLDNRQIVHPMGVGTGDPQNAEYLSPVAVAQLYDFPNTGAADMTIGIFENAAAGAAYRHSDIAAFIASLPAGYNKLPVLKDIGVTVGATTYGNDPALVTNHPTGAVGECVVDVSIAAAVAQGANVNVYFTDSTEAGWEAFLDRAILPPAGDDPPSVLTASWLFEFEDDPAAIGGHATPGTPAHIFTHRLRRAATRGITVFMAIGDWGSADLVSDGKCHLAFPNGDPWVTACGGTIVGDIKPTGFEEFAWSDAHTGSQFQGFPYVATGGGVSDNFPRPHYQRAAGVHPISHNDGNSRRGVPDVAGMVGMDGFFFAGVGGPGQYQFIGTSLVAPLYAGLTAVINAYLGREVGFLNPTLYRLGPAICRDVRFGNNDAGNGPVPPDAPPYLAGPGWDPCTGWGSINGTRLRAALAPAPIIVSAVAGGGDFGETCVGSFADETLTINNTGFSVLLISDIVSSSPAFRAPDVSAYPLAVAPGTAIDVVVRFQPDAHGATAGTLTIFSNDLLGVHEVAVSGATPAGKLAMTGSTHFGEVCCGSAERTVSICNVGGCALHVRSVEFARPRKHFELVGNPFPASLAPGSCLGVVVRYEANCEPESCELVVRSDDPGDPVKTLERRRLYALRAGLRVQARPVRTRLRLRLRRAQAAISGAPHQARAAEALRRPRRIRQVSAGRDFGQYRRDHCWVGDSAGDGGNVQLERPRFTPVGRVGEMAFISRTVSRELAVPVARAFDVVVAENVLPKVLHRWGPVPAVVGTRDLTGRWDTPGSARTVVLDDGSVVREQVLQWRRPQRFEYRVDRFTGPTGWLAEYALGTWLFSETAGGGAAFCWTYSFRARGSIARVLLAVFVRTTWARYMQQCADRCVELALAQT